MTKLTEGVSRRAVRCEPSTPRPAPPPATIANKAHVFTEDQNTMEWYIDGIPVAELKRRYEAHDALVAQLAEGKDDRIIGEYLRWLEDGNGNNLVQTMASGIIQAAPQWEASRQEFLAAEVRP